MGDQSPYRANRNPSQSTDGDGEARGEWLIVARKHAGKADGIGSQAAGRTRLIRLPVAYTDAPHIPAKLNQ